MFQKSPFSSLFCSESSLGKHLPVPCLQIKLAAPGGPASRWLGPIPSGPPAYNSPPSSRRWAGSLGQWSQAHPLRPCSKYSPLYLLLSASWEAKIELATSANMISGRSLGNWAKKTHGHCWNTSCSEHFWTFVVHGISTHPGWWVLRLYWEGSCLGLVGAKNQPISTWIRPEPVTMILRLLEITSNSLGVLPTLLECLPLLRIFDRH